MRPDMFKVIVERPRRGLGYWRTLRNHYRDAKHFKLDEDLEVVDEYSCVKLPMKHRRLGYDGKQLNENLNPLRRFLLKQVGRRWDDVYSEISSQLDPSSTVKQHVRDHLFDFVARNVYLGVDGRYWARNAYRVHPVTGGELFVDPDDGTLRVCREPSWRELARRRRKAEQAERNSRLRVISDTERYVKQNGVWYYVTIEARDKREWLPGQRDVLGVLYTDCWEHYGSHVVAISKQCVSRQEIKQEGLNQPIVEESKAAG